MVISEDEEYKKVSFEKFASLKPVFQKENGNVALILRMVPTFVTVHMFCASPDTRVSYGWCLLILGYFTMV